MKISLLTSALVCLFATLNAQDDPLVRINTKEIEYSPSLNAEGNYMIFQSNKDASEFSDEAIWKIYSSFLLPEGMWSDPVELTGINSKLSFVGGPNISYDGNTLYYTGFIVDEMESEDIFYSKRVGDTWSEPINLGDRINTSEMFEGFPSVSSDENSIYFLRVNEENPWDKKNKKDCFSIYVSHKGADGEWQEPQALPAPINMGCEESPKIMADNRTLIFSSIREEGKGSFDLYQSTWLGGDQWTDPVALDYLNTKESDVYPSVPASGDRVYYTASGDIRVVSVPEELRQAANYIVYGTLTDKNTSAGLKGSVEIINAESNKVLSTLNSNEGSGRYTLVLQAGNKYTIKYNVENYDPVIEVVDLTETDDKYGQREINVTLEQKYHLELAIKDAEIESVFPATIVINSGAGDRELEVLENKATLSLPVGISHTLIVSAKNYHSDTLKYDFTDGPNIFREEKTIALKPKKVPVSISLGNMGKDRNSRKIRVKNERTGEIIEADANEVLLLRSGDRYKVIVNSEKGYAFASDEIDLTNYEDKEEAVFYASASDAPVEVAPTIKLDIPMTKLTTGTQITLKNILFELNSTELDKSSFSELDQLVDMMRNNESLRIEIAAHTDDIGSEAANLSLSQRRAQSVADYLLTKGIDKNRFTVKGYGEGKPLVPNDTAENRARNRRVEFMVIE